MVGRAYTRLVNNIVQSLKSIFGKKPLAKLMLASNIFKKNYYVKLLIKTTDYN